MSAPSLTPSAVLADEVEQAFELARSYERPAFAFIGYLLGRSVSVERSTEISRALSMGEAVANTKLARQTLYPRDPKDTLFELLDALKAYIAACAWPDESTNQLAVNAARQHQVNVRLLERIERPPHVIAAEGV